MEDIKKVLRDQAIARALGEINAAKQTFYAKDIEIYSDLYEALERVEKDITENWQEGK